jgi:hypothetical protein
MATDPPVPLRISIPRIQVRGPRSFILNFLEIADLKEVKAASSSPVMIISSTQMAKKRVEPEPVDLE